MAATLFDPGECGCVSTPCNVTFNVKGCNSLNLPGATVKVWTDNTKTTLLGTGTTDAGGNVVVDILTAGSVYWEGSYATRLVTGSSTDTVSCGGSVSMTLTAATGYICMTAGNCPLPWKTVLNWTDSLLGATTLTYASGAFWNVGVPMYYGSIPFTSLAGLCGGISPCIARAGTLYIGFNGSATFFAYTFTGVCPGGASPPSVPVFVFLAPASVTCPPALVVTGAFTTADCLGMSTGRVDPFFWGVSTTITLTASE